MLENINLIIGLGLAIIAVIGFLFPKIRKSRRLKVIFIIIFITNVLVLFFNSKTYLHWKYHDNEKIQIYNELLPHIIVQTDNLLYRYTLLIENNYSPEIQLKNFRVELNSRMPLLEYNVLLSDYDSDNLKIEIKDKSQLIVTAKETNGGQIICISFSCKPRLMDNSPKNIKLDLKAIPIKLSYELYGRSHSMTLEKGLAVRLSNKRYYQKDIVFEKTFAIDHRRVFTEKTEYQYNQFLFDNNSRSVNIVCNEDKFIIVRYTSPSGELRYKSKAKICPECHKIDVLRVIVFKDGYFLFEHSADFQKEC